MEKRNRRNKINLIVMLMYIFLLYMPYFLSLSESYDITSISLSTRGWRQDGMSQLIIFYLLSVPFLVYQFRTIKKLANDSRRKIDLYGVGGCLILTLGFFSPFYPNLPEFVLTLHSVFSYIAVGFFLLFFLYILKLFSAKDESERLYRKNIILLCLFAVFNLSMFIAFRTATFFEGISIFSVMLFCFSISYDFYNLSLEESLTESIYDFDKW